MQVCHESLLIKKMRRSAIWNSCSLMKMIFVSWNTLELQESTLTLGKFSEILSLISKFWNLTSCISQVGIERQGNFCYILHFKISYLENFLGFMLLQLLWLQTQWALMLSCRNRYMECLGIPGSWSALIHINAIKYAHYIIIMHII